MRKRRFKPRSSWLASAELPGEQDGLFDVFANLVGVLTIVGALTAVLATTTAVKIKTPLAKNSDKSFVLVQVNKNGIWNLQPARDRVVSISKERLEELKSCLDNAVGVPLECSALVDSFSVNETIGQAVLAMSIDGASIQRLPSPTETASRIREEDSLTRSLLKSMARENKALFVILENDGFPAYRAIRELAREYNVPVGWEPWKSDTPVSFGSGGRSFNIQ